MDFNQTIVKPTNKEGFFYQHDENRDSIFLFNDEN